MGRVRGSRRLPQPVLMLVTDLSRCSECALAATVSEAAQGGVNFVQLRAKDLPAKALLAHARQLRGICGPEVLFGVNDRLDVALLSGADAVHLGENGLPVAAARQLLPPSVRVGRSVHSVGAARQAEADGADYLVVGTVFSSPSHPEGEPAGVDLVREVVDRVSIPVLGIGGITPENAGEVLRAGASGVAVVSAIFGAASPREAARALAAALGSA